MILRSTLLALKAFLAIAMLAVCATSAAAAVIQTITFDLSSLHSGSTLAGNFNVPDTPPDGYSVLVPLTFSDPSDYSPTSLTTTITVVSGTSAAYAVDFSQLTFTNLSGVASPINTRDVILSRTAFAQCASFPCTAAGGFQDRSPAVFNGTYTIAPAAVPEPSYGLPVILLSAGAMFKQRWARRKRSC
jgi:hypothetical protein